MEKPIRVFLAVGASLLLASAGSPPSIDGLLRAPPCEAGSEGPRTRPLRWPPGDTPRPKMAIAGRVLDGEGDPIAGARLQAFKDVGKGMTLEGIFMQVEGLLTFFAQRSAEVRSGPEGRYRITGLEPGNYAVRVTAEGFQHQERRHVEAGGEAVDFLLVEGGLVSGSVVSDPDGGPVPGARVSAYYVRDAKDLIATIIDLTRPPLATAETNASGRFAFRTLGPGRYDFVARAPGFQETVLDRVRIGGSGMERIEMRMPRGLRLGGRVLDPEGEPIEGARVKAQAAWRLPRDSSTAPSSDEGMRTGPDGRFLLDSLRDGSYSITVTHEAYAPVGLRDQRPGREIEIRLRPGAVIEGRVTDAQSGDPIAGARISVRDGADVRREASSDALGSYRVTGLSEGRRGERVVMAEAPHYARVSNRAVRVRHGEVTSGVDFRLSRVGGVSGIVVDEAESPVAVASVTVRRMDAERRMARTLAAGETGAKGRFLLVGIEPGASTTVVVQHPMYLEARSVPFEILPGMETFGLRVAMATGGDVTGRVVDEAGRPIAGATVKAQLASKGMDVNFLEGEHTATTDARGVFRIRGLEPGSYVVAARAPGHRTNFVAGVRAASGRPAEGIEIRLEEAHVLGGRVVDPHGRPIGGATVEVIDTSAGFRRVRRTTDPLGAFRFGDLGPVPVEVGVRKEGYRALTWKDVPVDTEGLKIELDPSGP